jgi:hypothetical protein
MERGKFKVIRTDGSEEEFLLKPTIRRIMQVICAQTLDTVRIGKNPANGPPDTIMMVDDIGSGFCGTERVCPTKSINERGTALYRSICKPGTTASIYGDVAIVNDEDFA